VERSRKTPSGSVSQPGTTNMSIQTFSKTKTVNYYANPWKTTLPTLSYKPTGFSWSQDTHSSAQIVGNWTKLTRTPLTKRLRAIGKRMQDFDIGYVLVCCVLGLASLNWHRWASIIGVVGCYLAHLEWGATCWRNVEAFYSSFTLSLGYLVGWKPWSQADPAGFLTLTNSPPLH